MPSKTGATFEEKTQLPGLQRSAKPRRLSYVYFIICAIVFVGVRAAGIRVWPETSEPSGKLPAFYSHVNTPRGICNGEDGKGVSHAGYISLTGDNEERPRRSFFWYFEAQEDPKNAPVILSTGGGPGTSGMVNALRAQSHCLITANGTIPNPHAWTERFNLIALDHPIGAGFSYGGMVNNSRSAAIDVYDFLQKIFSLYPHLKTNKFVINGGSYGGMYAPHIATVIHEQNQAIALGKGQPGAVHINLDSLMISNPISDFLSHHRWFLHQACYNNGTHLYNYTTCNELFAYLPQCLESVQFAYENPSVRNRQVAVEHCNILSSGDTNGVMPENLNKRCNGTVEDCFPDFAWLSDYLNLPSTKLELAVPEKIHFQALSGAVLKEFRSTGDGVQRSYLLYEPLLKDGIRLLHYIGAQDANCGWPGILSFLKLIKSPYQQRFINAPDIAWPSPEEATVRVVGKGAGDMTYILIADGGHFVSADQPALTKQIVEHWIDNRPFF